MNNKVEEIRKHYSSIGVDVDKLDREFENIKEQLLTERLNAKKFLKKRMGVLRFWWWNNMSIDTSKFGEDIYVKKANEYALYGDDEKLKLK